MERAHCSDVFDRLLSRQALSPAAHQAIRRLEADMTERRGEGDRGESMKVDGSGSRELVTQRMVDAGARVEAAFSQVGLRDAKLLRELLQPRHVLVQSIAEKQPDGQVVRVPVAERCG